MRKLFAAVLSIIIIVYLAFVVYNALSNSENKIISKSGFDIAIAGHKGLIEAKYLFVGQNIDSLRFIPDESLFDTSQIDLQYINHFGPVIWRLEGPVDTTIQLLVLKAILKPDIRKKVIKFTVVLNGKKTITKNFWLEDHRDQSLRLLEASQ